MQHLTKAQRAVLEAIHHYLVTLVTAESHCGIAPEHKDAVRRYVQMWITPNVKALLGDCTAGEWRDAVQYAGRFPKPTNWRTASGVRTLEAIGQGK